ncbi:MAG: PIG-L family deacetylase, partial [Clostridia bacterium]|nr:PIG-L family deacetylase [Clostridia bacterium]
YSQAERLWGSENTYKTMVGLIRKYKPDVVLTQDWNGEYGHNQHIMTARYCVKSVELAADANAFPAIAEAYGVWDVPKLYLHLWDEENRLELGFDQKLDALGGLSPMQVAFIAMDKHTSQLHNPTYSLLVDGRDYDCTCFGLYRSTVGPDVEKNSFFEHLE